MSTLNIVSADEESTVVSEYTPAARVASGYQSEAELERGFIALLEGEGYDYLPIHSEAQLVANLRAQLERLNGCRFTESEWQRFFSENITNANAGILEKTRVIQEDPVQVLHRDDGTSKNIKLIDKGSVHNNFLQVINQYAEGGGAHDCRYDVTVLVNGLPMVHVELKRRGVAIREAFNQIDRYQRDSFWAGCGLYEYIQIFVISNGTHTKYYSNTTRDRHIGEVNGRGQRGGKKASSSFEFTSYWADAANRVIPDLKDFAQTFFAKHTLLNILTRFCVFTSEDVLLVMRPYQIAATERILNRIAVSTNYKKTGTAEGGGYIWHTTGSGKTLTSFKTAQLACALPYVDKVLFVVDRKDLDYQTMKEYDRFEKGAANGNTTTAILERQLGDPSAKIIITTIQKLDVFISRNRAHEIYKKHVVLIFDECHRSQFGDMHSRIVKFFKNYHIFGFTGTPIFAVNAGSGGDPSLRTTLQAFGDKLHTYTIVDAINDGNVLPFRIDYVNTVRMGDEVHDKQVRAIDIERAMAAPKRISAVVSYVLEHFGQKTMSQSSYVTSKGRRLSGFNSIFAASSIPAAKKYYEEFKLQLAESGAGLKTALIYSFCQNEAEAGGLLPDEELDNSHLDESSRDFLEAAIGDYNAAFGTSFDTSSDKFQNYYKDLSQRVKNREVDILIVVNMFLTGFDATTLNTLWVDKNLKQHGLIQAFSRTNRILNSVKCFGNIVCFRDLKQETDDAISLFGDRDAGGVVLLKGFKDYYNGYEEEGVYYPGYLDLAAALEEKFPLGAPIVGEDDQKEFIRIFGAILRVRNILTAFDEFAGDGTMTQRDLQDQQSRYIDIYNELRPKAEADRENINDDIVFEMELVKQIEVNIDYILALVAKYHESNCQDKKILTTIESAIGSSIELRSKKELIEGFIARVNAADTVDSDWREYVTAERARELDEIIAAEKLRPDATRKYISDALRDGALKTTGTGLDKLLPPMPLFGAGGSRAAKKQSIIEMLRKFFEKYWGV